MNMNETAHFANPRTNNNMALVQGKSQIEKARQIQATLGTFTAARYMAKRGWSLESAQWVLLGR